MFVSRRFHGATISLPPERNAPAHPACARCGLIVVVACRAHGPCASARSNRLPGRAHGRGGPRSVRCADASPARMGGPRGGRVGTQRLLRAVDAGAGGPRLRRRPVPAVRAGLLEGEGDGEQSRRTGRVLPVRTRPATVAPAGTDGHAVALRALLPRVAAGPAGLRGRVPRRTPPVVADPVGRYRFRRVSRRLRHR